MSEPAYAVRSLIRARWFTVAAVLTFALGIGITVAVFSVVDRLLFRTLPYGDVDQLVLLRSCSENGECAGGFPSLVAFEGRQRLSTIDGIAVAAMPTNARPSPDQPPLVLNGVSENLLRVLRVQPVAGRDFTDEDRAETRRVVLLSHETWERRFGASPDVLGQSVSSGATPAIVVGVLPRGFIPPTWTGVAPGWDGLVLDWGWAGIGPTGMVGVPVARLTPGSSVTAAQAEIDALVAALAPQLRGRDGSVPTIRVDPIQRALFSRFRPQALLVVSAAFVLLLLACANLATLLLARGRSREQAAAIRAALGASRARLVRAALFESLAVCLAGAAVALAVIAAASQAVLTVVPPLFARYAAGATDARVLAFALTLASLSAVAAALAPALRVTRVDLLGVLQRAAGAGQRTSLRGGRGLLALNAALAVVLLSSGLLITRSFANLSGEDLGFRPDGLYTVGFGPATQPRPRATADESLANYEQLLEVLAAVPGVRSAGGADSLVASRSAPMRGMSKDPSMRGGRFQISAGYFDTLRTPFIAGRTFSEAEVRARTPLAVLSISAARIFFPSQPPADIVGRTLVIDEEPPLHVVGVVPDLKQQHGEDGEPALYVPLGLEPSFFAQAMIRAGDDGPPSAAALRDHLAARLGPVNPTLTPVSQGLDARLQDPWFRAVLFSVLALSALLLAGIGLFAVTSLEVTMRRHEMAVRLSLGARAGDIGRLVVLGAVRPVTLGVIAGLVGAYWAERFLRSFLYGIDGRDPLSYAAALFVLLAAALAAAWLPARRAVSVDPAAVLRAP